MTKHPRRITAGGFTLVEMLVVIGIIVLLIGLALFALAAGRTKAEQARMAADLQTIAVALDAYKADFGDYPRVRMDVATVPTPGKFPVALNWQGPQNTWSIANPSFVSGAELLCWALIGPYPQNPPGVLNPFQNLADGSDGPGFRLNRDAGPDGILGTADDVCRGQVYQSYLNAERFKFGPDPRLPRYSAILDSQSNPILYFPLTPQPAGRKSVAVADRWDPATMTWTVLPFPPAYDMRDNDAPFWRPDDLADGMAGGAQAAAARARTLARMRVMLGDRNYNGAIDPGETPPQTLPFLLWSAGPDGLYGPTNFDDASQVNNCDDVTNIKY